MNAATWGFFGGSDGKEPACNAGDLGLIPGLGRSSGEGNGNSSILVCTLCMLCLCCVCTLCISSVHVVGMLSMLCVFFS